LGIMESVDKVSSKREAFIIPFVIFRHLPWNSLQCYVFFYAPIMLLREVEVVFSFLPIIIVTFKFLHHHISPA
jgi:hypothetical protein